MVDSRGSSRSLIFLSIAGDVSASVISESRARSFSNDKMRTSDKVIARQLKKQPDVARLEVGEHTTHPSSRVSRSHDLASMQRHAP